MRKLLFSIFALLVLSLLMAFHASAALWGEDASNSGELDYGIRTASDGDIVASGEWANSFELEWNITASEDGSQWTYSYDITADRKAISHFILEVTNDGQDFQILDGSSSPIIGPETWYADNSNPDMPNSIYGIKFDYGAGDLEPWNVNYTIVTNRAPVYGMFYGKDGMGSDGILTAWNYALQYDDSNDPNDFIIRPNGQVPIPSAAWLLGGGLIGLVVLRRRIK